MQVLLYERFFQLNSLDVFIVQDETTNVFAYVLKDSGFVVSVWDNIKCKNSN